jgi:peptide/nickel transport system substrate-binding protein
MTHFKNLSAIFFVLLFAFSCGESLEEKTALGGKKYGGTFTFITRENTTTFFPLSTYSLENQRVLTPIFEPLLRVDIHSNKVIPNIAKRFNVSKDGKTIELIIRDDVYFQADKYNDDEAEKLKIEDVKFSLEFACSGNKLNQLGHILTGKIVGSKKFQSGSKNNFSKKGVEGIDIKNDSTLVIHLTKAYNNFIELLSHPNIVMLSKKAYDFYGENIKYHPIGTGPFMLKSHNDKQVVLARNDDYWKKDEFGNQLPFLSEIRILNQNLAEKEGDLFSKGKVDVILELPVDKLDYTFGTLKDAKKGKNVLHRIVYRKGVKVNFFAFDCKSIPFKDVPVRKAFLLALDKDKMLLDVLNGDGNISNNGFVPKSKFFQSQSVKGVAFNPQMAKQLMAEAGYKNGAGFPELALYVGFKKGTVTYKYCEHVISQINQNLNLRLTIKSVAKNKLRGLIRQGKVKLLKTGWVADYPNPEAYLGVFYTGNKGENNGVWNLNNFKNATFDALYERSILEQNTAKKLQIQQQCDQLLMDQTAILPLFTEDIFMVVNIRVRDFEVNQSGIIDFTKMYIKNVSSK